MFGLTIESSCRRSGKQHRDGGGDYDQPNREREVPQPLAVVDATLDSVRALLLFPAQFTGCRSVCHRNILDTVTARYSPMSFSVEPNWWRMLWRPGLQQTYV